VFGDDFYLLVGANSLLLEAFEGLGDTVNSLDIEYI